jgi:hypothetical protein
VDDASSSVTCSWPLANLTSTGVQLCNHSAADDVMSLLSNALSIDKHDQEIREAVEKFKNQVTTADCQPYSSDWKKKIVSKCDKAQDIVKAKFNKIQSASAL